ncbi:MAG: four helix bundle protein [Sedimentisphaerales bacterium]|nr:four helix bundle protein [Sedimentisphaerales bacterium]
MREHEHKKITNFGDLDVWKKGMEIVKATYQATNGFPRQEIFGLTRQMRRSAVSIPSNVAEGFNRFHNKEYRQFLYVTLGSCAELETQTEIAAELGYLGSDAKAALLEMLDHESRMLRNLVKRLN